MKRTTITLSDSAAAYATHAATHAVEQFTAALSRVMGLRHDHDDTDLPAEFAARVHRAFAHLSAFAYEDEDQFLRAFDFATGSALRKSYEVKLAFSVGCTLYLDLSPRLEPVRHGKRITGVRVTAQAKFEIGTSGTSRSAQATLALADVLREVATIAAKAELLFSDVSFTADAFTNEETAA